MERERRDLSGKRIVRLHQSRAVYSPSPDSPEMVFSRASITLTTPGAQSFPLIPLNKIWVMGALTATPDKPDGAVHDAPDSAHVSFPPLPDVGYIFESYFPLLVHLGIQDRQKPFPGVRKICHQQSAVQVQFAEKAGREFFFCV